jgi:hypothetical protein
MRSVGGAGSMASVATTIQELGYDLARKALDQQEAIVGDLHARAGTLLTATALVATFLGARAVDGGNRILAVAGVGFAIGSIVVCVYVLTPQRRLSLAISGSAVRRYFVGANATPDDAYVTLADWIDSVWHANQLVIERLLLAFRAGAVMLVMAIGLWSLGLAIH